MSEITHCMRGRCNRPAKLVVQYVIPNKFNQTTKKMERRPWVCRHGLCRYHLAAHNHPRHLKRFQCRPHTVKEWRPDEELIAEYNQTHPAP